MKHVRRILRGFMRLGFIAAFFLITGALFTALAFLVDALYVWSRESHTNGLIVLTTFCVAMLLVVAWSIGEDKRD